MKNLVPEEARPMQADQYKDFLDGKKELCVLEKRKDSNTFGEALHDYVRGGERTYHLHLWRAPEGIEAVLGHLDVIQRYIETLHDDNLWDWHPDKARRRLGKLFGYSPEDIAAFIAAWTPEYCMCSKCVGVKRSLVASAKAFRLSDRFTGSLRAEEFILRGTTKGTLRGPYVSGDDIELDTETAAQVRADRKADDRRGLA